MKTLKTAALAAALITSPLAAETTLGEVARNTVVHGYITADWQGGSRIDDASEDNKIINNMELYRFIIGTHSQLSENIVFASELEIEHATRTGVKTSSSGGFLTKAGAGLEIELEQAWVEFRRWQGFQPRVGVVLIPVGRLNLNHDADVVSTVDRPLVDRNIMPTTWFEPGVGFTGTVETGSLQLSYQAYLVNGLRGSAATAGNEGKIRDMRMHKDSSNDNNNDKAITARLAVSPLQGLEIGFSGYRGAYDPSGSLFMTYGAVDGIYRRGWLELQGEWVELNTDLPDQDDVQSGKIAPGDPGYFLKADAYSTPFASVRGGWYAQALVRVPAGDWGRFEPFVNVSQVDPNKELATANDLVRYTLGLNYRPVDNVVVKLNYADTQYVKGYIDSSGDEAPIQDRRLQASLAASY